MRPTLVLAALAVALASGAAAGPIRPSTPG